MIEFAKILGETTDNKIRIKLRTGEEFSASTIVLGNSLSLPSSKWVEGNKNNFLAIVAVTGVRPYEVETISPVVIIIGFYPVTGADSTKYDLFERLLEQVTKLSDQLSKAKVNTSIGPQPFMPDSMKVFTDTKTALDDIAKEIMTLKL